MANEEIIRKNLVNISSSSDTAVLKTRFNNSLNAVNKLFQNKPPVYATWIRIQIGKSDPILFDSTSTSTNENLIAQLDISQNGSGTANNFVMTIKYDPFRSGQVPSDTLEQLDYIVSEALMADYNSDLDFFRGTIQYGYSGTDSDNNLVSPKYEFELSKATSNTKFSTGITTYTFEGVSYLGMYCDVTANIGQMTNWGLMDIVCWHLYYYFGNYSDRPRNYASDTYPREDSAGYSIDIPDELFEDQVTVPEVNARSDTSIWTFCLSLLQEYPLTQSEINSGNYDNMDQLPDRQKPRYIMYITDESGKKTIHIKHIVPMETDDEDLLDYEFTWGDQKSNLIKEWSPDVDLTTYLLRRCETKYKQQIFDQQLSEDLQELEQQKGSFKDKVSISKVVPIPGQSNQIIVETAEQQYNTKKKEILDAYQKKMVQITNEPQEVYNAQITLQGIPADPPLGVCLVVKPVVLETISRTAGYYYITSSSSSISTKGSFTTVLQLFRMRGLNETTFTSSKLLAAKREAEKSEYTNSSNSSNAITATVVPDTDVPYDEDASNTQIPNYRKEQMKNPTNPIIGNTSGWSVSNSTTNLYTDKKLNLGPFGRPTVSVPMDNK